MQAFGLLGVLAIPWLQGAPPAASLRAELPLIRVTVDDTRVTTSARLVFGEQPIEDRAGDGVVWIEGAGLTIECSGTLRAPPRAPEERRGIGLVLRGRDIRLRGASLRGFRIGVLAEGVEGLSLEGADVRDGFQQRLRSTPLLEDAGDWLRPHDNDGGEWLRDHGAALALRGGAGIAIEGARVRGCQNGIVLERVRGGRLVGNDASFLSGWGLALWRSSELEIRSNRFDFCVRGYSHGAYNRGQDSAGILMFEQCRENRLIGNSACYGGDGIFAFAGREALELESPSGSAPRGGVDQNLFEGNRLSHNAAHGLELTFSFDNQIRANRFEGNAICGVWLGYGRRSRLERNLFLDNGDAGYGTERGGINAEHAQDLWIAENLFRGAQPGLRLWSDADQALAASAWVQAHGQGVRRVALARNRFEGRAPWIELAECGPVALDPPLMAPELAADTTSLEALVAPISAGSPPEGWNWPEPAAPPGGASGGPAARGLLGADELLRGDGLLPPGAPRDRAAIVIEPYGPYDWEHLWLEPTPAPAGRLGFRLLGPGSNPRFELHSGPELALETELGSGESLIRGQAHVVAREPGLWPFELEARTDEERLRRSGSLLALRWRVAAFATPFDPRQDPAAFAAAAAASARVELPALRLPFGSRGPGDLPAAPAAWRGLPADRFGIAAAAEAPLPAGRYVLRTLSDDGLRVYLDGQPVIDDWTWHGPRPAEHAFELERARTLELAVEHFELDGWATLEVWIEPR
jgi:nitrous oxidase accessory protein NosD